MKKILAFAISLIFTTALFGQPNPERKWEKSFQGDNKQPQKIHDILLMRNGQLILVGEAKDPQKQNRKQGLFMIIDSETGNVIEKKLFGSFGDDALLSVTWGDWSFFVVGYSEREKGKGKDAWLLELEWRNDELLTIQDTTYGARGDDYFEKILWTNNSTALIAGHNNKADDGNIWLLGVDNGKIISDRYIGSGICKDIIGLEKSADGNFWLCGNTKKDKKQNRANGSIWWTQINAKGEELGSGIISDKAWETTVNNANRTVYGDLLLAGKSSKQIAKNDDESFQPDDNNNNWATEINANQEYTKELLHVNKNEEEVTTILRSPKGLYWTTTRFITAGFTSGGPSSTLSIWHDLDLNTNAIVDKTLKFIPDFDFEAVEFLRTSQGAYILAGNLMKPKNKNTQIKLICWENGSLSTSKGDIKLEHSKPELLDNKNKDGILSPGERGAIKFSLKNIGDTDILEGIVLIKVEPAVKGLAIEDTLLYFSHIPVGVKEYFSVSVFGEQALETKELDMRIKVLAQGKEVLSFIFPLKCGSPVASEQIEEKANVEMSWQKPKITTSGSREDYAPEDSYTIELSAISKKKLDKKDFKVQKNGEIYKNEKSGDKHLTDPIIERDKYQYTFTFTVRGLEQGENIISVQLESGEKTDSIIIHYEPVRPNLHVLAIGPTYSDLQYPSKDARDFAKAIARQKNGNFFKEVFIDTLLTYETTTENAITSAIEKLYNRGLNDQKNRIKPNDYVILFFSGHGTNYLNRFRLKASDYQSETIRSTTVDYKSEILEVLSGINCKIIVFIDACLSGNAKGKKDNADKEISAKIIEANKSAPGIVTFTSCSAQESSWEDTEWGNGAYTKALIEALNGDIVKLQDGSFLSVDVGHNEKREDANDGYISIAELTRFLEIRVLDLVSTKGLEQTPTVTKNDFEESLTIYTLEKPKSTALPQN